VSAEPCPACGNEALESWRPAHQVVGGRPGESWALERCRECGTAVLAGRGSRREGDDLYDSGTYASQAGGRDSLLAPLRKLADRERLRLLGPLPAHAHVIEIGAGRGRLLAALRARGHDAVGIEPASVASRESIAAGLRVQRVTLEDAEFPAGEADAVVLWHVLEHLKDPHAALEQVRRWVDADGRLVVAVPNLGSLQARLGGDRWFHQDVPRHRTHFTVPGLKLLLQRTGFAPTGTRHVIMEQNWLGMWLTLLNPLTVDRDVPFRFAKRDLRYANRLEAAWDALISVVVGIPLIPIAVSLELAAGLARRGGTVVVHASPT
jgi:SAM-dependent methyltransferase